MDVAAMNVRITFQKNEPVSDTIGNHTNRWTDYYSCHATVSDSVGKSSAESEAVGQIVAHPDISFTVRFCRKAKAVDTTGFRILWDGGIYDILKVDHLSNKKRALKFKCEKAGRGQCRTG